MDPIIAGIIAGILALATLALVGVYIAAAVMCFRVMNTILNDFKDN